MRPEIEALMRPVLRDMVPYHVPVHAGVIKLDANENPYPFPTAVRDAIWAAAGGETFNRYPDGAARALRDALADYAGVAPGNVLVGNGSDEIILNLLLTFGTGRRVLIAAPTFGMYRLHSLVAGAEPVEVPRGADFAVEPDAFLAAARAQNAQMVFLCSPNNPTGNVTPPADIERLLREYAGIVVVDEAYAEFAGTSAVGLLSRYPRLVLLRTFSKAFGLAGLRVGYMLAGEDVVQAVWRVKQPFNVNAFSQAAALAVLGNQDVFREQIEAICRARDDLYSRLEELPGVTAFPSRANFILFRTPLPAGGVYEGLLRRGVLVRNVDGPLLPGCLRVTIGRPEENTRFLDALADVLRTGK
ncbi:MAG: histidinol-phosphate transaminase [Desulfotomaculales bacterium]